MNRLSNMFAAVPLGAFALALVACGGNADESNTGTEADAFAARINSSSEAGRAPQGTQPPRIAKPLPGAAPGPFAPGTATDPASATCGANKMGPYIGKAATDAVRSGIVETLGRSDNVRFIGYGSDIAVNGDPTNPRLNLMLDAQNIIRDARCG